MNFLICESSVVLLLKSSYLLVSGLFLFFLLYFSLYFCNFAALNYLTTENKDSYNEKDIYSSGFCALHDDACRG